LNDLIPARSHACADCAKFCAGGHPGLVYRCGEDV